MDTQNAQPTNQSGVELAGLTANIVAAFVGSANNHLSANEIPGLISSVHLALSGLGQTEPEAPKQEPAVSIRASVKRDHIVCLEDGAKLKMLKRYIMTRFNLTPDEYRAKWGLPADYPMVAPDYAEKRRELAKSIGLGTKGRTRSTEGRSQSESNSGGSDSDSQRGRSTKAATNNTAKRGPGRPRKDGAQQKRGPGRPRKNAAN